MPAVSKYPICVCFFCHKQRQSRTPQGFSATSRIAQKSGNLFGIFSFYHNQAELAILNPQKNLPLFVIPSNRQKMGFNIIVKFVVLTFLGPDFKTILAKGRKSGRYFANLSGGIWRGTVFRAKQNAARQKKRTLTVLFVSLSSPRTCWPAEAIAAKPAGTQTVFRRLSVSYSVLSPLAVQFLPDCPGQ